MTSSGFFSSKPTATIWMGVCSLRGRRPLRTSSVISIPRSSPKRLLFLHLARVMACRFTFHGPTFPPFRRLSIIGPRKHRPPKNPPDGFNKRSLAVSRTYPAFHIVSPSERLAGSYRGKCSPREVEARRLPERRKNARRHPSLVAQKRGGYSRAATRSR